MHIVSEEERLRNIANRYHSDEEYAGAGEDVGYLLSVLYNRDKQISEMDADFNAFRETANETTHCYNSCHQDSWVLERALRRIANKSIDEPDNIGLPGAPEQQKIALDALETVWKRREERSQYVEGEMNMNHIGTPVEVNEKSRIYTFPNGSVVKLLNIKELVVRESGTHRIKTKDGKLHIVSPGWLHIEIDADDWTV